MSMSKSTNSNPIVSKIFCSSYLTTLMVRKRPHVVNGGGFAVTDCSRRKALFTVDGCGVLGAKGALVINDGDGASILQIRKKGGVVQVLSFQNKWRGYQIDEGGPDKLVFTLSEPRITCAAKNDVYRIHIEPKRNNKDWNYQVTGSFLDRECAISDRRGNLVAQVTARAMMGSEEFYNVVVQPGFDQAFVVGVIAILDNIHGESTRC